jgi:hypothetical protein
VAGGNGSDAGLTKPPWCQFEITPEQKQLKETAHRFAAEEIIPIAARCDEERRGADLRSAPNISFRTVV